MRSANVLLRVGMLRGYLREAQVEYINNLSAINTAKIRQHNCLLYIFKKSNIVSFYLPRCGLPSEELVIERAVRRVKLWLQEDAAVGYCLQRGGTFVREAKSDE